jgi:RsiW-degrading membrane proteinase PrsW (M82 family)
MPGTGALFILILISSIPVIVIFMWFRLARYPFSSLHFSFSLLAGAVSFFPALFLQNILAAENGIFHMTGKWDIIAGIFVRAFTEEFSRFIMLIILFFVIQRLQSAGQPRQTSGTNISAMTTASATGLIAGLGFAILESAVYGASNPGNPLLRIFTAAPLHGACGFRVGSSIAMFQERPIHAFFRFLSAVAIHGIYNFLLIIPGLLSSIAAILIALAALISSVLTIRNGMKGNAPIGNTAARHNFINPI